MNPVTPPAGPASASPVPNPNGSLPDPLLPSPSANTPPAKGTLAIRKGKKPNNLRRVWQVGGLAAVACRVIWLSWRWFVPSAASGSEITAAVQRADLPVIVTERGTLESARTIKAKCEVEGEQCKIAFLVPEGTR